LSGDFYNLAKKSPNAQTSVPRSICHWLTKNRLTTIRNRLMEIDETMSWQQNKITGSV